MKTINEKKLLEVIFNFYNSPEKKGAIVLPTDQTGNSRWYITKITNAYLEFLEDQPLLKEISKRNNIDWNDIKRTAKKVVGIGSWLRFVPGVLDSKDILINQYNIQPYPVEHIDDIPEEIIDLFHDSFGQPWYPGPLHHNKKLDEFQCCYYEISEDELKEDIKRFREGKNEYHTNFEEDEYTFLTK